MLYIDLISFSNFRFTVKFNLKNVEGSYVSRV